MRAGAGMHGACLTALVLVFCGVVGCGQGAGHAEEDALLALHGEMVDSIERAHVSAAELRDFNWSEFASVGLLAPPAGLCAVGETIVEKRSVDESQEGRWFPLPGMLPSADSSEVLLLSCDRCLDMAEKLAEEGPLAESHAGMPNTQELAGWRESCARVESALGGARHLAGNFRNTARYQFNEIENALTKSGESVRQGYLEKFQDRSADYIGLLDDIISSLHQTEQAASRLSNWQFGSRGAGE